MRSRLLSDKSLLAENLRRLSVSKRLRNRDIFEIADHKVAGFAPEPLMDRSQSFIFVV